MFKNTVKKLSKEEKEEIERIAKEAIRERDRTKLVNIMGNDVMFITQDYSKPEEVIQFSEPIKQFEMDMNFVTIASAQPKDVLAEDYDFTETSHVFIDYPMTRLITFNLQPMSLKEMIWNISKIYTEIFKSFTKEAKVCCNGYEFLYLKKLRVHNDNVISIVIDEKVQKN